MLGLAAASPDHLWWQFPQSHCGPASAYGPIFGPLPTARISSAAIRDKFFSDVQVKAQVQDLPALLPFVDEVRKMEGKESAVTEPAEQTYERVASLTEEASRAESSFDTEANCHWRDGIDDEFPEVDVELIRAVWKRYIANDGDSAAGGTTLMCHDLLNKFTVEPDLLQLFEKVGLLEDVVYVYLPLTYLKSSQTYKLKRPSRNKGYGFVHFSSDAAAAKFAQLIRQVDLVGTGRGVKQMYTTLAKFQGVGANLVELLDLENVQWRPKQGCFYVRLEPGGPLNCLGISPVRSFVLEGQKLSED
jgi:hypothetical protein